MSREAHVRFWESAGVKLPRATHLLSPRLNAGHAEHWSNVPASVRQRGTESNAKNRAYGFSKGWCRNVGLRQSKSTLFKAQSVRLSRRDNSRTIYLLGALEVPSVPPGI
jgi:hypothetical protein